MSKSKDPWVVILAGGDGRRLEGAVVDGQLLDRPKQFCRFRGETLLQRTLRRSGRITDSAHTLVIVRDDHRQWWQRELERFPNENILLETHNRGTAVAVLHAAFDVLERDHQNPILLFLPSDHSADKENELVASARSAAQLAAKRPKNLVLLGIMADRPEMGYGWILPGREDPGAGRTVKRFVEKPEASLALGLFAEGALWNSFIFASSAHLLFGLFKATQPRLVSSYLRWSMSHGSRELRARELFLALPSVDFCQEVLKGAASFLRVLVVPRCGWTDLGTPDRVQEWLGRDSILSLGSTEHLVPGQLVPGPRLRATPSSKKEAFPCPSTN